MSMSSRVTERIATGSMSGFSFMATGAPTSSFQSPRSWSSREEISISAVSMFAPSLNCMTTTETLSLEEEVIFFTSVSVAKAASMGRVMSSSTRSGVAPT